MAGSVAGKTPPAVAAARALRQVVNVEPAAVSLLPSRPERTSSRSGLQPQKVFLGPAAFHRVRPGRSSAVRSRCRMLTAASQPAPPGTVGGGAATAHTAPLHEPLHRLLGTLARYWEISPENRTAGGVPSIVIVKEPLRSGAPGAVAGFSGRSERYCP